MVAQVSRSAERPIISYTDQDLDLLARLVTAEAGGEPLEAQVGVAAVVLNRVQSSKFPNSIYDVIYAPNQFSPVRKGWINKPATTTPIKAGSTDYKAVILPTVLQNYFDNTASNSFLRVLASYSKPWEND